MKIFLVFLASGFERIEAITVVNILSCSGVRLLLLWKEDSPLKSLMSTH
jgi:hypothetical protein